MKELTSRHRKYDDFYKQAWHIVQQMRRQESNKNFKFDHVREYNTLFRLLQLIEHKTEYVNYQDMSDFFISILLFTKKNQIKDVKFDDLKESVNVHILGKPVNYNYYFNIGTTGNFPEGYQIGYGKIYPFSKLNGRLRSYISAFWKSGFQYDKKYITKLEDFMKHRESEWFMHVVVTSLGYHKATERAIELMNKSMNIYKIVYQIHSHFFMNPNSSFDYYFENEKGLIGSGDKYDPIRGPNYYRAEFFDNQIRSFNEIVNSKNKTELEYRLLNALDIYGMIDDQTPLHVGFLLCVISLESLLLDKGERDYLGWKLSEKVTFLLGDKPAWFSTLYKIGPDSRKKINSRFIRKNLAYARSQLFRQINTLYGKRSTFAHSGSRQNNKAMISHFDYQLISSLLRWIVQSLLELRDNGIEYIHAKDPDKPLKDTKSLNTYIENLKYTNH